MRLDRIYHLPAPFRFRPLLAACLLALPLLAEADGQLTDLGALGGKTWFNAGGISADGTTLVGAAGTTANDAHAFRWTQSDGMTDLGTSALTAPSSALGVSADGAVIVGSANASSALHAFRWTQAGGMVDIGTLGGSVSRAYGVSADGAVVVGEASASTGTIQNMHAFRWTQAGGMVDLGTMGGNYSVAYGASADGAVVVGGFGNTGVSQRAFRWTQAGGMVDLGALGGTWSKASGVSADGAVVVGFASNAGDTTNHAFRWTPVGGMADLGTLGGIWSSATAVSADGKVVVGESGITGTATAQRAFRWTQATGMLSVENWLRANGVTVATDVTYMATSTNRDGSVVVGCLYDPISDGCGRLFIARVSSSTGSTGTTGAATTSGSPATGNSPAMGSGLVTLNDLQQSLAATASGGAMAMRAADTVLNGAHSRPLLRRVGAGQNTFWVAGDWGTDEHGARSGSLGLAEFGLGRNFGGLQLNLSAGQTWARQTLPLDGSAKNEGSYLHAEALFPLADKLWATIGAYGLWGESEMRRSYLNAGAVNVSQGTPKNGTWGTRARVDWEDVAQFAGAAFTPYVDLSYLQARLAAYGETGGGFAAGYAARTEKATELRLGVNAARPLMAGLQLTGTLEAVHRFEKSGARTVGEVVGLFGFDMPGRDIRQDWMRVGLGVEGKLAGGVGSLSLNATTQGEALNTWVAANWQRAF